MEAPAESDLVTAAQSGDEQALDLLLRRYLPLVYNVVGRALNGDPDVDDVVQETMVRAARRLGSLRDPDRFRSWLIAIAIRQIQARGRTRARRLTRESPLEQYGDQPAPEADFVGVTVLELALSGQRREVVEATRWLSADDRRLLALWWQEVAGVITRAELVEAAGLNRRHASVRIQRLKDRLEVARLAERARQTGQGCPRLVAMVREAGPPGDRQLNRLSRHVGRCEHCRATGRRLLPPESLLAGAGLLPVPDALVHGLPALVSGITGAAHGGLASLLTALGNSATQHPVITKSVLSLKPAMAAGAATTGAAAVAITLGVMYLPYEAEPAPAAPSPSASARALASPSATTGEPPGTAGAAAPRFDAYAMAYFTDSPTGLGTDAGLHLAVSSNGLDWMPLHENEPVLSPTAGTRAVRDPFVLRRPEGGFVVLAADVADDDIFADTGYIHSWTSPDLRTFSYRRLRMHTWATHTWGPEAFYDPARRQYGIVWSANRDNRESIFVTYTTDFREVGAPQLFFDPGYNVQDPTVVREGGAYELYFRDNRDGTIGWARSTSLDPRSFDPRSPNLPQSAGVGGPTVVRQVDGKRRWLWGDSYDTGDGLLYAWQGTVKGGTTSWSRLGRRDYGQPLNARHGGIVPITDAERDRLVDRWGGTSARRIASYNYPDRLLRHENFAARFDPYPFDPFGDSLWRLVPGLADPSAVSFRSVTMPDRYLRDTDSGVELLPDDGSAAFRRAATFVRVPGLADRSWTSYRSFSDPTRYLRHSQFVLRADPITNQLDREDATFRVGY